ncbi:MAG: protein-L-isoaspartate(D-aspartate) O-methyltransferase [Chitinivibrionales bacterium]|nr:protein-L-isoaspartate(D-aspartate) O-methyltransferase [Chitinivibrionales bacterium]
MPVLHFCKICKVISILTLAVSCQSEEHARVRAAGTAESYASYRRNMVRNQIEGRGIKDTAVLNAMLTVKRHLFVGPKYRHKAYADHPLPIGHNQTISQPYIVAFMTEILNVKPTDKILEIGTGSGYQAAILAELCDSVFTIEIVAPLGEQAKKVLDLLGYYNVKVAIGDGYKGWPGHAPFDAIIVTCAPTDVPEALKQQLKEGGRMIIPVGESYDQKLVYLQKRAGKLERMNVLPVRFVPMVNEKGETY